MPCIGSSSWPANLGVENAQTRVGRSLWIPPWCTLATSLQLRGLRVWRRRRASDSLDYTCIRRKYWLSCLFRFLIITSRLNSSTESQMAPQEPPSDAPRFLGISVGVQCVLPGAVTPYQELTFGGNEEVMKDNCCQFVSWLEAFTRRFV